MTAAEKQSVGREWNAAVNAEMQAMQAQGRQADRRTAVCNVIRANADLHKRYLMASAQNEQQRKAINDRL
jgi:hypothetical protein